jgi:four helix bundle protein
MISHERLAVWHRAHRLSVALLAERALDASPAAIGIGSQLRRATVSVAANIAEGAGSPTHAAFARYLGIAIASAHEVDALVRIARDARLVPAAEADAWLREAYELRAMLFALRRRVLHDPRR